MVIDFYYLLQRYSWELLHCLFSRTRNRKNARRIEKCLGKYACSSRCGMYYYRKDHDHMDTDMKLGEQNVGYMGDILTVPIYMAPLLNKV